MSAGLGQWRVESPQEFLTTLRVQLHAVATHDELEGLGEASDPEVLHSVRG